MQASLCRRLLLDDEAPLELKRALLSLSPVLPRLGLASLALCLASGAVLSIQYRPMGDVFRTVEAITSGMPYGAFLRQMHQGSGQIFVILMLLHTADYFLRRRYAAYPFRTWCRLVASLLLCFLTLFTGFILKGDLEGIFAGRIMASCLNEVPLLGPSLSRLMMAEGEAFFYLPFLYHSFFLPILVCILIRDHVRDWFPDRVYLGAALLGLAAYALWIPPDPAVPPDAAVERIHGPWFFYGIQYLLRHLPAFWAGVFLPSLWIATLLFLPLLRPPWSRLVRTAVMAAVPVYIVLSLLNLV